MSLLDVESIKAASLPCPLGPGANGMLMTAEEYDSADDWVAGHRYELIHGVLIVSPPAGIGERSPNDHLGYLLRAYQESHASGSALDDTAPEQEIAVGDTRRRADRAIWAGLGRPPKPLADTPTIAVEFVSESTRDRRRDYVEKRAEYAAAGVKEYWVIDRFARAMTVLRGATDAAVVKEGDTYSTPLLPGFELPLAALLAKADQYTRE